MLRSVCLLLVLSVMSQLIPASVRAEAGHQEDFPELGIDVRTIYARENGEIDVVLTVGCYRGSGNLQISRVKDLVISASGTEGMEVQYFWENEPGNIKAHGGEYAAGDIDSTYTCAMHCKYTDPVGSKHPSEEKPGIRIFLDTSNCGTLTYTASFDVYPQARAVIFGRPDARWGQYIQTTMDILEDAYTDRMYDGRKTIVSVPEQDVTDVFDSEGFQRLASLKTDDNDITYIYLGTHGLLDGSYQPLPAFEYPNLSNDKNVVDISEYLSSIHKHIKGRIVLLMDFCFSGYVLELPEIYDYDPDRTFVATATTSYYSSGTAGDKTLFGSILQDAIQLRDQDVVTGRDLMDKAEGFTRKVYRGFTYLSNYLGKALGWILYLPEKVGEEMLKKAFPDYSLSEIEASMNSFAKLTNLAVSMHEQDASISENDAWSFLLDFINNELDFTSSTILGEQAIEYKLYTMYRALGVDEKLAKDLSHQHFLTTLARDPLTINIPQFYGNADMPIFVHDEDFDDAYRMPDLLEETEEFETTPPETVKVYFDGNEGSVSESGMVILKGEAIQSFPAAERVGYELRGWNTKPDATGEYVTEETEIYDDIVLYAIWELPESIDVVFSMEDGDEERKDVYLYMLDREHHLIPEDAEDETYHKLISYRYFGFHPRLGTNFTTRIYVERLPENHLLVQWDAGVPEADANNPRIEDWYSVLHLSYEDGITLELSGKHESWFSFFERGTLTPVEEYYVLQDKICTQEEFEQAFAQYDITFEPDLLVCNAYRIEPFPRAYSATGQAALEDRRSGDGRELLPSYEELVRMYGLAGQENTVQANADAWDNTMDDATGSAQVGSALGENADTQSTVSAAMEDQPAEKSDTSDQKKTVVTVSVTTSSRKDTGASELDTPAEPSQDPIVPEEDDQRDTESLADESVPAIGSYVLFGSYPQRGAEKDPIEWQVLDVSGSHVLLISRYGLDAHAYNRQYVTMTWERSSLRQWLNDEFFYTAFSSHEQESILVTNVDNSRSQGYEAFSTDGGNDTDDRVFLLSYAEAAKYFGGNTPRKCAATPYARYQGVLVANDSAVDGQATGRWWLRSPGKSVVDAGIIDQYGVLEWMYINWEEGMVRPVLWMDSRGLEQ